MGYIKEKKLTQHVCQPGKLSLQMGIICIPAISDYVMLQLPSKLYVTFFLCLGYKINVV